MKQFALFLCAALASAHGPMPINSKLGVPGFPDCVQPAAITDDVDANAHTLVCKQNEKDSDDQIAVGCIGDSITAGVHSSGGNHTYPGQLQIMLDESYPNKYKVTNLGACGSTMMKGADSPYWKRPQYKTLTSSKWDILIIMLGTNDAKDAGSHGPHNWPHNCTGEGEHTCPFATSYRDMITLARTLGTNGNPPKIYTVTPPPLMEQGAYGMNQTVINDVLPVLVPAINKDNNVGTAVIDIYTALGGASDWPSWPKACHISQTSAAQAITSTTTATGAYVGDGVGGGGASVPVPSGCFIDSTRVSYHGGNIFGDHHIVNTSATADGCCKLCQQYSTATPHTTACVFWQWDSVSLCYGHPGPCCRLKSSVAWSGRGDGPATTTTGSIHPLPAPPPQHAKCPLFCDEQSCDQCHPDDNGYTALAAAMKKGLGL